ncbi:MAG: polysaccharide deacetylase family protein [Spirochaetia bacterium]|nr:polysaccharide deacetylase family protein [Spirochaetia bacterium]
MLPTLSRSELKMQLQKSKDVLEKEVGVPVKDLAYPFGLYDRRVIEEAQALGYRAGFTVNLGVNHRGEEPFTLSRYMVTSGTSPAAFLANLEISSPSGVEIEPADGSVVQAGQKIVLKVPGIADGSLALKMGGKGLDVNAAGSGFTTLIPKVSSGRGYLTLVLKAKTPDNRPLYRQYLFLDASKFPQK